MFILFKCFAKKIQEIAYVWSSSCSTRERFSGTVREKSTKRVQFDLEKVSKRPILYHCQRSIRTRFIQIDLYFMFVHTIVYYQDIRPYESDAAVRGHKRKKNIKFITRFFNPFFLVWTIRSNVTNGARQKTSAVLGNTVLFSNDNRIKYTRCLHGYKYLFFLC